MIITRTPLRVSLGGGGTDLPSYYREHGGLVISVAISSYIYIGINPVFSDNYILKYAQYERVTSIDDIEHPIIREALRLHKVVPVEIVSLADIPSGTGLGSSGAFTVGLLRALCALRHEHQSTFDLAEEACRIEIDVLGRPGGKQDQYAAAFGGITCFEFHQNDGVEVSRLTLPLDTMRRLEDHLLLFFTGYSRSADEILSNHKDKLDRGDKHMVDNLHTIKEIGREIKQRLEASDLRGFAELMHDHWERKRLRLVGSGERGEAIDRWYQVGREHGALGGKLVGAGGGGFLMFYTEDPDRLRMAMDKEGLPEVRFTFDHDGSMLTVRD